MTLLIMTSDQARSYNTARFNSGARAMQPNLPRDPVRIVFIGDQRNSFHDRIECVFACFAGAQDDTLIGTYYQNALMNFSNLNTTL